MDIEVATDHIRDGCDCIMDSTKTLKRVERAFPEYADRLAKIQVRLIELRSELDTLRQVMGRSTT